ncbi:unnamed protein product [Vicia faba]|uniref:Uncharacterized protein n=1 Tax=Vicia faba TaxID=3906 RepID=A0AAV0YH79_VICFA|nr:unnamed protein product [Vicia faba]
MTVKLFNYFGNENHNLAFSSTSNIPIQEPTTFTSTPDVNIESDYSGDETVIDDSLSDSSCEFNAADANYDSSSSYDDEDVYDSNSTSFYSLNIGYSDIGDPIVECTQCGALMWYQEKTDKRKQSAVPKFQLCCGKGKVVLPLLKTPPLLLQRLLFDNSEIDSRNYQQFCRMYNMMFAFTSPGMKFDNRFLAGSGPPNIRIHGQTCHRIGSMLPLTGQSPKFAQLYVYDTDNEI